MVWLRARHPSLSHVHPKALHPTIALLVLPVLRPCTAICVLHSVYCNIRTAIFVLHPVYCNPQVGHTIQDRGINDACGGQVLRVDVGLSKGCGNGAVQVLEILGDGAHIVRLQEGLEPQRLSVQQQAQVQVQQQKQLEQKQPEQKQKQPEQPSLQQQQQTGQGGAAAGGSWLPGSWKSLWQDRQGAAAGSVQDGKQEASRAQPTPA